MRRAIGAMILAVSACSSPKPIDRLRGDERTANEAIAQFVARGEAAIPELREGLGDSDPTVRRRARTGLARITGQWGSSDGIVWKRSMSEAVGKDRPILALHLFGKFDEEFC